MPIFDYLCGKCNKMFEKIAKSDMIELPCKHCDGVATKQVSAPARVIGNFETDVEKREIFKAKEEVEKRHGEGLV